MKSVIIEYLKSNGYDGLYNDDCGCVIANLAPCCEYCLECEPGHLMPCDCGEHDWHIGKRGNEGAR